QHLASPASRRVMRDALNLIATEVLEVPPRFRIGREPAGDADFTASHKHTDNVTYLYCAWSALRHSHTSAVRDWLARQTEPRLDAKARYAPATVNRMLAALRGVLKEAWRLGEMSAEDYFRASDVQNVAATLPSRGRSVTQEEMAALLADC